MWLTLATKENKSTQTSESITWPKEEKKTEDLVTAHNTFGVKALFQDADLGNLYHLPPISKLNVKRERNLQKCALPFQNYSL